MSTSSASMPHFAPGRSIRGWAFAVCALGLLAGCPKTSPEDPGGRSEGGSALVTTGSEDAAAGQDGGAGTSTAGTSSTGGTSGGPAHDGGAPVIDAGHANVDSGIETALDAGAEVVCDPACVAPQRCELVQPQCIQAPCPPLPQCVDNPCAVVRCKAGTTCTNVDGQAQCLANGTPCGKNTCQAGYECCNASCGICTPPDSACIQIVCD
jgi:hypothetical protein